METQHPLSIISALNMVRARLDHITTDYYSSIRLRSVKKSYLISSKVGDYSTVFKDTDVIGFRLNRFVLLLDLRSRVQAAQKITTYHSSHLRLTVQQTMLVNMFLAIQIYHKFYSLKLSNPSAFTVRARCLALQLLYQRRFLRILRTSMTTEIAISRLLNEISLTQSKLSTNRGILSLWLFRIPNTNYCPFGASPSNIAYYLIVKNQALIDSSLDITMNFRKK